MSVFSGGDEPVRVGCFIPENAASLLWNPVMDASIGRVVSWQSIDVIRGDGNNHLLDAESRFAC